jgi:hypothetical protein
MVVQLVSQPWWFSCHTSWCNWRKGVLNMMCFLQAVQHAQQALQAAELSGQQQSSMVPPNIALIALLLSARCVHSEVFVGSLRGVQAHPEPCNSNSNSVQQGSLRLCVGRPLNVGLVRTIQHIHKQLA